MTYSQTLNSIPITPSSMDLGLHIYIGPASCKPYIWCIACVRLYVVRLFVCRADTVLGFVLHSFVQQCICMFVLHSQSVIGCVPVWSIDLV